MRFGELLELSRMGCKLDPWLVCCCPKGPDHCLSGSGDSGLSHTAAGLLTVTVLTAHWPSIGVQTRPHTY